MAVEGDTVASYLIWYDTRVEVRDNSWATRDAMDIAATRRTIIATGSRARPTLLARSRAYELLNDTISYTQTSDTHSYAHVYFFPQAVLATIPSVAAPIIQEGRTRLLARIHTILTHHRTDTDTNSDSSTRAPPRLQSCSRKESLVTGAVARPEPHPAPPTCYARTTDSGRRRTGFRG